jgi:hypothetical protein
MTQQAPRSWPRRQPRLRRRTKLLLLVLALAMAFPAVSFAHAMTYAGNAPASVRAVEWVRDHGGGPIVDRIETWRYARQAPAAQGKPNETVDLPPGEINQPTPRRSAALPPPVPTVAAALPGEGQWAVVRRTSTGAPALSLTWFRADAHHLPVSVAAALGGPGVRARPLGGGARRPQPG